jgi:c-di-GMP-binding flagellar brake protein YcgR
MDEPRRAEMKSRQYRRAKLKVPIYISLPDEILKKMIPFESEDISEGGLCFQTKQELPLEADSRIVVSKLADLHPTAHIEGRITYRREDAVDGHFTVGVEFTGFVNVTRRELAEKIASWEAGLGVRS